MDLGNFHLCHECGRGRGRERESVLTFPPEDPSNSPSRSLSHEPR